MCDSVFCNGVEYSTPRKLAVLLGGEEKLVWQDANPFTPWPDGKDWKDLDLCLCPVELAKTLSAAGFVYRRGDDPMEWFVTGRS